SRRPVATPGPRPPAPTPPETPPPRPSTRGPGPAAPPLRVPTGETSRRSWDAPTRTVVDRELTSSWIAQAFPFPAGTPPLLLQFLGHLASESLNRTPPDPGLFETETEVVVVGGAPGLRVSTSVDPFEAADWEGRRREAVVALGSAPPEGSFFDLTRRRLRSQVLLDLAAPESVVRWLAAEIAAGAEAPEDPEAQMWRLERDAVAEAARAAGPPRTLVFGPQGLTGP